jgi:hypothetical protein
MLRFVSRGLAATALLLGAVACSDLDTLTDVTYPPISAAQDSVAPTVTLTAPGAAFQIGDTLKATVKDDNRVESAVFYVLDAANNVLHESAPIKVGVKEKDLAYALQDLPRTFPYGDTVFFTVKATDALKKVGFPKTDSITPSTLKEADKSAFVVGHGRTVRLPEGSQVAGFAFDRARSRLYFTDQSHNRVGAFSLASLKTESWWIKVGSRPAQVAIQPGVAAGGNTSYLAVFNDGGFDVSLVEVGENGGAEVGRTRIPNLSIKAAPDTIPLDSVEMVRFSPRASSLLLQCEGAQCKDPTLYMSSVPLDADAGSATALTRSLRLFAADPGERFSLLTAPFNTALAHLYEADEPISLEVYTRSAALKEDSLVARHRSLSLCGTFSFGSPALATTEIPAGPLFVGGPAGLCAAGVRRYDWDGTAYRLSGSSAYHAWRDTEMREIAALRANADGSMVAIATPKAVLVADGELARLAELPVSGARGVAFLDQLGTGRASAARGRLIAVSTGQEVTFYETTHFTRVGTLKPAQAIKGEIFFLEMPDDLIAVVGLSEKQDAFVVVQATLSSLLER